MYKSDVSVVQSVSDRCNKKVSNSIVVSEILQMSELREESLAVTLTAEMVIEYNGKLIQQHGADIWTLTEDYSPVLTDSTRYDDPTDTMQMDVFCPPALYDHMNQKYGQRGWRDAISKACGMYTSQPFMSLNHVLRVQRDIIRETYETDIGQWFADNSGEWIDNFDAEIPHEWGQAYQSHVTRNTPRQKKREWITHALRRSFGNRYISPDAAEGYLTDHFGLSNADAERMIKEIDFDRVNVDWFNSATKVLDSDVLANASGARDVYELTADMDVDISIALDGAPEEILTDEEKEYATQMATRGLPGDAQWHDLTWASRVTIACDFLDPKYVVKYVETGDNQ